VAGVSSVSVAEIVSAAVVSAIVVVAGSAAGAQSFFLQAIIPSKRNKTMAILG
jgi:hypothetical protein